MSKQPTRRVVTSIAAAMLATCAALSGCDPSALEPAKPSNAKRLEVEVVALDGKWLFIYPEQRIASVNRLVTPVGTAVHFRLTAATETDAFFVSQLGSESSVTKGVVTEFSPPVAGSPSWISVHYDSDGVRDTTCDALVVAAEDFSRWVTSAQTNGPTLDEAAYRVLQQRSQVFPHTFSTVTPRLFDEVASRKPIELADARAH